MNQATIFAPMFAMLLLTLVVWTYMYIRRIRFITGENFAPDELTPALLAQRSPPAVSNPSDNLKNLFELPVLFYVLVIYLFLTSQVDALYLGAAWVFVLFRGLHSAVHTTINIVILRFALYLISSLALWFIALRAMLHYIGAL